MSDVHFEAGGKPYGLSAADVVEIVPAVALGAVAGAPAAVAGVFRYRGGEVPVVDLGCVLAGAPVVRKFSTRILIVNAPRPNGHPRLVGLLAEQVLEVGNLIEGRRLDPEELTQVLAQMEKLDA